MSTTDIERRLTAIERELARLRERQSSASKPHPIQALEQIHGTFEDDNAFREAARLGRRWRAGQHLGPRQAKVKRR